MIPDVDVPIPHTLVRPYGSSVGAVRKMFELKKDDSGSCFCGDRPSFPKPGEVCNASAMRVYESDYDRPERIFL